MWNQFHRTKDYYTVWILKDFLKYGIVAYLLLGISGTFISIIMNSNLTTGDALLNVTRIASHEAVNTTLDEDLSNCTTSSLKDCTLINNGTWYIEAKNSFYGKLLNYSYFIDNGGVVSCKVLRDGNVSEENGLPCAHYVGLVISLWCLLSAVLIGILECSEPQKVTGSIAKGLLLSWFSLLVSFLLNLFTDIFEHKVQDFPGNIVGGHSTYYHTLHSLLHFYWLALVGWISVLSQRHFLVMKESGTAVSTWEHVSDVIARWSPYCLYFSAFLTINWLLSYAITLFSYGLGPACDESCLLTQDINSFSFIAPVAVFALFNINGVIMLKYNEQYLEHPHLKKNFVIVSKLFYFMLIVWAFGVLVNYVEFFGMFRFLFNAIALCEGIACPVLILILDRCVSAQ